MNRGLPVIVGLALSGAACFDEPPAPGGRTAIEKRYLGEWDCTSAEGAEDAEGKALLTVLRFDESQYYAEWKEDGKVERYRAYHVRLKGVDVFNVAFVEKDAPELWAAMRATVEGDGSLAIDAPARRITELKDDAVQLRTFRREADQPTAWQPFVRCTRQKD